MNHRQQDDYGDNVGGIMKNNSCSSPLHHRVHGEEGEGKKRVTFLGRYDVVNRNKNVYIDTVQGLYIEHLSEYTDKEKSNIWYSNNELHTMRQIAIQDVVRIQIQQHIMKQQLLQLQKTAADVVSEADAAAGVAAHVVEIRGLERVLDNQENSYQDAIRLQALAAVLEEQYNQRKNQQRTQKQQQRYTCCFMMIGLIGINSSKSINSGRERELVYEHEHDYEVEVNHTNSNSNSKSNTNDDTEIPAVTTTFIDIERIRAVYMEKGKTIQSQQMAYKLAKQDEVDVKEYEYEKSKKSEKEKDEDEQQQQQQQPQQSLEYEKIDDTDTDTDTIDDDIVVVIGDNDDEEEEQASHSSSDSINSGSSDSNSSKKINHIINVIRRSLLFHHALALITPTLATTTTTTTRNNTNTLPRNTTTNSYDNQNNNAIILVD